jgi:hypothetical protein
VTDSRTNMRRVTPGNPLSLAGDRSAAHLIPGVVDAGNRAAGLPLPVARFDISRLGRVEIRVGWMQAHVEINANIASTEPARSRHGSSMVCPSSVSHRAAYGGDIRSSSQSDLPGTAGPTVAYPAGNSAVSLDRTPDRSRGLRLSRTTVAVGMGRLYAVLPMPTAERERN